MTVGDGDDRQHRGILDVDDEVVADLGHDVAQGLWQDDMQHRLPVVHADSHGTLGLAWVDGDDAAADRLGHVSTGVDGYDEETGRPHAHFNAEHLQQAVVDENGLHDHGRAAEQLNIAAQHYPQDAQQHPLPGGVTLFIDGDRLQSAHGETDQAAKECADQCQQQGSACAAQIRKAVFLQHIGAVCQKVLHGDSPLFFMHRRGRTAETPAAEKSGRGMDGGDYSLRGCTLMASPIMAL